MINFEFRPLRYDDNHQEEGRCVGCRSELSTPLNLPPGAAAAPSLIFPDAPNRNGNLQGLCVTCLVDLQPVFVKAREHYRAYVNEKYGITLA